VNAHFVQYSEGLIRRIALACTGNRLLETVGLFGTDTRAPPGWLMTRPSAAFPEKVNVFEVGPRDGLQNERIRLSVEQKLRFIDGLADAGLRDIEVGSFVHPKWIPQMADTAEVVKRLKPRDGVRYWALVPNQKGLENALKAGIEHIAIFLSSSETHNKKNINRTIDESLTALEDVVDTAVTEGLTVRGYISTVFGCPYEGDVDFERVVDIAQQLFDYGVWQVSLGDTTGMGSPLQIHRGVERAIEEFGDEKLALHLHDTRGLGLANALVALEAGMTTFDGSTGGMGGCPYAPGASGNLGTEDLIHMLNTSSIKTGVDLDKLLEVSRLLENEFGATLNSRFYRYRQAATRA
jgi:hydroxymethylglutaryl-CoA lyase